MSLPGVPPPAWPAFSPSRLVAGRSEGGRVGTASIPISLVGRESLAALFAVMAKTQLKNDVDSGLYCTLPYPMNPFLVLNAISHRRPCITCAARPDMKLHDSTHLGEKKNTVAKKRMSEVPGLQRAASRPRPTRKFPAPSSLCKQIPSIWPNPSPPSVPARAP